MSVADEHDRHFPSPFFAAFFVFFSRGHWPQSLARSAFGVIATVAALGNGGDGPFFPGHKLLFDECLRIATPLQPPGRWRRHGASSCHNLLPKG
jgi:hypothetical protein